MLLTQRLFVGLPARWQHALTEGLRRSGLLECVPLFRMFLRVLEFAGARPADVRRALRAPGESGWMRIADLAREEAERLHAGGHRAEAAAGFHRAALYAISGCWNVHDAALLHERYPLILACLARYSELADPPVERLSIPTAQGNVAALLRKPRGACRGAVILFPGSDQTKEWMAAFECPALEQGLATLSIDLPGFGESRLSGAHLKNLDALRELSHSLVDALLARLGSGIAIGAFGVSLGGAFALVSASWEPRLRAVVAIGSPLTVGRNLGRIAAAQREAALAWSGASSLDDLTRRFDERVMRARLAQIRVFSLVLHGDKDEVVELADAEAIARTIGAPAHLRVLPNDDHMGTRALAAGAAAAWFAWLAGSLDTAGPEPHRGLHAVGESRLW